ncbi:MAG: IS4 family transposase, partial [Lysobacterales bacterium]
MQHNKSRHFEDAQQLRQQFGQHSGGAFDAALSAQDICAVVERQLKTTRHRRYPPLKTLSLFIGQVLCAGRSCQDAVVRHLSGRVSAGKSSSSLNTAAYCEARKRLPTAIALDLGSLLGQRLQAMAPKAWRWQGRSVKLFDGTSVSMPDTPSNQAAFPQSRTQKPGLGFPMARIGALIGLASGAVLGYQVTALRGKGSGEQSVLHGLMDKIEPDDIVLADALLATWWLIHAIASRGADVVMAQHGRRSTDFAQGKSLGTKDHIVEWPRPPKPAWMSAQAYADCPPTLRMREIEVGGRVLVTTLQEPGYASAQALDRLYAMRWNIEVDFRTIKATLEMDVLRCKSSQMIEKEIAVCMLAYNLVRWAMNASASLAQVLPRALSFAGCKRLLVGFFHQFERCKGCHIADLIQVLLASLAKLKLPHRPDRVEPRAKKRRPKNLPLFTVPRQAARQAIRLKRG